MAPGTTATVPKIVRVEPPEAMTPSTSSGEDIRILDIDQIQPYEHNPRLLQNPKWQEIEASILASGGLTQALSVTKRSGDDQYTVHQGGNTRLRILKKLYSETSDARYRRVPVEVQPYTDDFDLAALHDRENVCRGDLIFIERAWSKFRQFEHYCQEGRGKSTSRAFIAYLGERYGDTTPVEKFSRMKFAVEVLYQHIPTCLVEGGMTETAVRYVIGIRTALERVWLDRRIGTKAEFGLVFFELLARQDRDLAETFLSSKRDPAQFPDKRIAINWDLFQSDFCHECTIQANGVDHQRARAWVTPVFHLAPTSPAQAVYAPQPHAALPKAASASTTRSASLSVATRQAKALGLARRLAEAGGFSDLIEATPSAGYGYRMVAAPSRRRLSEESKACWWALVLGLGETAQASLQSAPWMGNPSITGLSQELLLVWAALLKVHARLIPTGS